jgi:hypothetical protein
MVVIIYLISLFGAWVMGRMVAHHGALAAIGVALLTFLCSLSSMMILYRDGKK